MSIPAHTFIPPEQHWALLLTWVNLHAEEAALAVQLAGKIQDWEKYHQICLNNKVAPMHYYQLHALGLWEMVPQAIQKTFATAKELVAVQNQERTDEAMRFLTRFKQEGFRSRLSKVVLLVRRSTAILITSG